MMRKLYRDSL